MRSVQERGAPYATEEATDEPVLVACFLRRDGIVHSWCAAPFRGDPRVDQWVALLRDGDGIWGVMTEADLG